MEHMEPMEIRIFTCPNRDCGFNIAETHYKYARTDLTCARCGKHKLSEYLHKGKTYQQWSEHDISTAERTGSTLDSLKPYRCGCQSCEDNDTAFDESD